MSNLKLEAGKYYRTSRGAKVFIIGKVDGRDNWIGQAINGGFNEDCVLIYRADRTCSANDMWNKLVAEWVEPKRIQGWLAITSDYADAKICETREEAIRAFAGEPSACIKIDVLEGEGLSS